jgi:hypothetical protein
MRVIDRKKSLMGSRKLIKRVDIKRKDSETAPPDY